MSTVLCVSADHQQLHVQELARLNFHLQPIKVFIVAELVLHHEILRRVLKRNLNNRTCIIVDPETNNDMITNFPGASQLHGK